MKISTADRRRKKSSVAQPMPMATRSLPKDRRDLQPYMVEDALGNFFAICQALKLFKTPYFGRTQSSVKFAKKLFKLVQRRHTHLWNRHNKEAKLKAYTAFLRVIVSLSLWGPL